MKNETYAKFIGNERFFAREHYFPRPRRVYSFVNEKNGNDTLDNYRQLLATAYRQNNFDLKLLISPSHARQWEVIRAAGLWCKWEEWKQALVRINEEEAHRAGKTPFTLWDFSGYNSITTEAMPNRSDPAAKMRWYTDSSHFNGEVGNIVMDKILGYHAPARILPDDFGVKMMAENIETHLMAIRNARQRYAASHITDVLEVKEIINEVMRRGVKNTCPNSI